MKSIWFIIYNTLVIPLIYFFFSTASLFNSKIKLGLSQRNSQVSKLRKDVMKLDDSKKLLWFHSASLGEFEQAKPVIEKIKNENDVNILISFFSPSGYDNSQNYPYADLIAYIPIDKVKDVKEFLDITKPEIAIFMRYDIWPNLIWELDKRNIS